MAPAGCFNWPQWFDSTNNQLRLLQLKKNMWEAEKESKDTQKDGQILKKGVEH